jgi:hypothetical protein
MFALWEMDDQTNISMVRIPNLTTFKTSENAIKNVVDVVLKREFSFLERCGRCSLKCITNNRERLPKIMESQGAQDYGTR